MIGLEFIFHDGTSDSYDPVNYPDDFEETDTHYILNIHYEYKIEKKNVKSIRKYSLCEKCGYETKDNQCSNCDI